MTIGALGGRPSLPTWARGGAGTHGRKAIAEGGTRNSNGRSCTSATLVLRFRVQSTKPVRVHRTGFEMRSWRRPPLPRPVDRSTVGADRLNDRVRDGNGCGPVALVASRSVIRFPSSVIRHPWLRTTDNGRRMTSMCCDAEAHLETEKRSSLTGN